MDEQLVEQAHGQALLGDAGAEDGDVPALGGGQGGGHGLGDVAGQQRDPRSDTSWSSRWVRTNTGLVQAPP